nr:twin-arginine translocase TatA/TatE family subunit [Dissulfurirhabdus thermomarina]
MPELLVIFVVALLVLGPEQLPAVARRLARLVVDLRRTAEEFRAQLNIEDLEEDLDVGAEAPAADEARRKAAEELLKARPDLSQADREPGGAGPEWKRAARRRDDDADKGPGGEAAPPEAADEADGAAPAPEPGDPSA